MVNIPSRKTPTIRPTRRFKDDSKVSQSQQQIIPSILESTRTLQNSLSIVNVTMVPKSFFEQLSLSMKYIGNIKSRLKKNREFMKSHRCFPIKILVNNQANDSVPVDNSLHYVEMLSVFRIKSLEEESPFLIGSTNENDPALGLSPTELSYLVGSKSGQILTKNNENQKDAIFISKKRTDQLQEEMNIQMDEFEVQSSDSDEEMDIENINIFKQERNHLVSTVLQDERNKPQIEADLNEIEKIIEKLNEPVTIIDPTLEPKELEIDDPLSIEQRQQLEKQLKENNIWDYSTHKSFIHDSYSSINTFENMDTTYKDRLTSSANSSKIKLARQIISLNIMKETLGLK